MLERTSSSILVFLLAFLMCLWGCAARPRQEPAATLVVPAKAMMDKPVIDFARGGAGLPLEGVSALHSQEDLVKGLTLGYEARLILPELTASPILAAGVFPMLSSLRIDLSNSVVREDYKPKQMKSAGVLEPALCVANFEYIAAPLHYQHWETYWRLAASGARLGLLRDHSGQSTLVLTDAVEGSFEFSMNLDDLPAMLLAGAKSNARGGFVVRNVALELKSDNPHSLEGILTVNAAWLFFPATFQLTGRCDVDGQFNVHLSKLSCHGEDLGGKLVAGAVDRAMQQFDGRIMPLARWPGDRIALREGEIRIDGALRLTARFGQRLAPQD